MLLKLDKTQIYLVTNQQKITTVAHPKVIRKDFNEICDHNIINELKSLLRNHHFVIDTDNRQVTTDVLFIRNFVTQIKGLLLSHINTVSLKRMIRTLSTSHIKVCFNIS